MKKIVSIILLIAALTALTSCALRSNNAVETFPYTGEVTYGETTVEESAAEGEGVEPENDDGSPRILFDGEDIKLNHPLVYKDGVLYAYINDFASVFGAHTVYSGKEVIFSTSDTTVLIFKRGVPFFTVVNLMDGSSYALYLSADVQYSTEKGRFYIPAVDVANGFGFASKYYEDTNTLVITTVVDEYSY